MSYSATETPSGTYYVTNNGAGVATVSQSGLAQYGLSPTNLTQSVANTPVSNGASTMGTGGASIAYGVTNSPGSSSSAGYQFIPVSGGIQVSNNGQSMGVMSLQQAANLGYSNPIPSSVYSQVQGAVQNGTMSPQQAVTYLQGMIGSTYTGSLNTSQLFPAGFTYQSGGATYQINNGNYASPVRTSTQVNASNTSASTGTTSTIQPTGNANLDAALGPLATQISNLSSNGQIPSTLQITPALVGTFLSWAHSVVDPQTQQLLTAEAANVNNALSNAATDYANTQAESLQGFGTSLASEQNDAGNSGTAFSGQRDLNEQNMVNSENRTLSTNASDAALSASNTLNAGAAAVGSSNANMFNLPTFAAAPTVSNTGGSRGSANTGTGALTLGYNPSTYTAGSIPSSQSTALTDQENNYLNQYSTLAANNNNGTRSVSDLLGMITGVPAGSSTAAPAGMQ